MNQEFLSETLCGLPIYLKGESIVNGKLAKNMKLASGPQITKLRNFAFQTLRVKEKTVSLHFYQCLSSQEKCQYL